MASFIPFLSHHKNKDNTSTIFIRITTYYEKAKVSTDIRIKKADWNPKAHQVRVSHINYSKLNKSLQTTCLTLDQIYTDGRAEGKDLTAAEIKLIYEETKGAATTPSSPDLFEFAFDYFDKLEAAGKWNTVNSRRAIFNKFKAWLGKEQIGFGEITSTMLENYKLFLLTKNKKSTVHVNFKRIKEQFNRANRLGIFSGAFPYVQLEKGKVNKIKLSMAEIALIETADFTGALNDTRNYFLFSFYCAGIRFSDVCTITRDMIRHGRIKYDMGKTGTETDRALHPKAIEILKEYDGKGFIFPILDEKYYGKKLTVTESNELKRIISSKNAIANGNLKKIAAALEIKKNITFHSSRHSFADIARKKDISVQKISELLRHSSIAVTQAYFGRGFDDDILDDALKSVID